MGDDRRVKVGKERSIGNVKVGDGVVGTGYRGSRSIYLRHSRIRNCAA